VSVSTDGSVSVRLARRLRPVPAAGRIETESRDSGLPAREVLEALPAAVYTIDAAGRITFFNRPQLTFGVIARSSARASGAAPGGCIGPTADRCGTMSAPWPWR
jgi:hypothetical protein